MSPDGCILDDQRPRSEAIGKMVDAALEEIRALYLSDEIPWIVGYSGGKDSTATLQLVWEALVGLDPDQRTKIVYVITNDTLVENPMVASWVIQSHKKIKESATRTNLPILPHMLHPELSDTFWVNLIGRGYPAPRPRFRWCTERLKIGPSDKFVTNVVSKHGEAIFVLGTRRAESSARAHSMNRYAAMSKRELLSPSASLANCSVYSPIRNWTNNDVWAFLLLQENPWGHDNEELFELYQGATPDRECPFQLETGLPSCGDSRFGCWVCTLVDKDRSLQAMIQNDEDLKWMSPLLELRDELNTRPDSHWRDFRRMSGAVQLLSDGRPVPGPYTQVVREGWLKKLLKAQTWLRDNAAEAVRHRDLITLEELELIRKIWVFEKHEIEDSLPRIYEETIGQPYPGVRIDDNVVFGQEEIDVLRQVAGGDTLHFELCRDLLALESGYRTTVRRARIYDTLEGAFAKSFYADEQDATDRAMSFKKLTAAVESARQIKDDYSLDDLLSALSDL